MVEGQVDVAAVAHGLGDDGVDRLAGGVLDDPLAAGSPSQLVVERELEPGEATVVDTRVAEHLRGERELRVEAPLLGVGVDPRQPLAAQLRDEPRICLARDVDEAAGSVTQRVVDRGRVEMQRAPDHERLALRVLHLVWIGVDGLRLLADRELHAAAVVDRPARRRNDDVLALLTRREPPEGRRAHALQPGGAHERQPEREHEDAEQQADAAVRGLRAHRVRGPSRTKVVSAGFAGTSPRFWA